MEFLTPAPAILLILIGSGTLAADLMGWETFAAAISLGVTFVILTAGIVWSLRRTRADRVVP